jgi:tetratricopeptide (TPR) repeat protein
MKSAEERYGTAVAPYANGCLFEGRHAEYATSLEEAMERGEVEETFDSWDLVSACWMLAGKHHEKVINALRKADALSKKGDTALRLGQYYLELEMYQDAEISIRRAISIGTEQDGTAWLLLGIALYHMNNYEDAIRAFHRAKEYEDVERAASQWLELMEPRRDYSPRV